MDSVVSSGITNSGNIDSSISTRKQGGGNIVGEHTVIFFGENESFEITHKAYSRGVFAEGALKGAEYIVGKENGYYSMDDII